jgi:hypothetical protein
MNIRQQREMTEDTTGDSEAVKHIQWLQGKKNKSTNKILQNTKQKTKY